MAVINQPLPTEINPPIIPATDGLTTLTTPSDARPGHGVWPELIDALGHFSSAGCGALARAE